MDAERWEQIEKLYHAAAACEAGERGRLLEQADPEVKREVERMLAQDGSLLDRPAWDAMPDTVTVPIAGQRFGRYEVEARLGAGGMGEVFRARDTRLNRTVALKISKTQFSERFEREARAIAALNHPNICQLHDVGHHGGVDFLVMEYLEGETLSSRLKKGALPLEQTLEYGMQIADALEKAHRKGITHRDLKPGNIMLTKSGAKLLDFGLAKWKHRAAPEISLSQLPTETAPITARGTILGTLQYMSPEQLEGKEADARTDIFTFGAVLYEMATGKKAFEGQSQASLIAKILESNPAPMRSLQPMTPAALERLVKGCLAKDPDQRLQSAQDVKLELGWIRDENAEPVESRKAASDWRTALPWLLFAATALGLVAFAWLREAGTRNTPDAEPVRFEIPLSAELTQFTGAFALSPDGRKLAFPAVGPDGTPRIWIRDLNSLEMHALAGTDSAGSLLIWSPDSRSIAFDSGGKLERINISGGFAKTLCNLDKVAYGGSWNKDAVILFGGVGAPLKRVWADGGDPVAVTVVDTAHGDVAHINPRFLPDGRHFLYMRITGLSTDFSVGSLDAKPGEQDARRLINGAFSPTYVPSPGSDSGRLLFVRGTALMEQEFDAGRLALAGDPVRAMDAPVGLTGYTALYSTADNGTLIYRAPANPQTQLIWFDETGKLVNTVGAPGPYDSMVLSPDATQAIVTKQELSAARSVWSIGMTGKTTPLENDPATYYGPGAAWSPDGREIVYGMGHSGDGGLANLWERPIDGSGEGKELLRPGQVRFPLSWSPEGFLLFNAIGKGRELWELPLKAPASAAPLLQGGPMYADAHFSPDGHWVTYISNESSRFDVYVRSFSEGHLGAGGRVSPDGGINPRWSGDGKQLYYVGLDYKLMKMRLTLGAGVQAAAPAELFPAPHTFWWAPSPDGKRFLFLAPQQQHDTPITVVLNWQAGLKR